jgi:hypothetical protein
VRAVVVEMVLVLCQGRGGVALVDDEDPVEELAADAADEALGDRVDTRRPNRRLQDLHSGRIEDRVKDAGELGVAVADEVPELPFYVVEIDDQVSGLLGQSRPGGVGGDAEDVEPGG